MTDLDAKEPLSNVSDSSFVILGQGSMPPSMAYEATREDFTDKNQNTFVFSESNKSPGNRNTPSRSSDGQSFLEDDLQEKVKQLIKENYQLKETLSQNNLAIRSQLDTFYMWQQEVLKTHETHKQKFLETKDLILKLRAENLNLKKQLDESFYKIANDDSYLQIHKKREDENLNQVSDEFENVSKELIKENEILEMENTKLNERVKAVENEVLKLNGELEDALRENKFFKHENDELKKNSASLYQGLLPNSEALAQISNLLKQLEIKKGKMSKLKEKLKKANYIISKVQNSAVKEEVDEYFKNSDNINLSFDGENQTFSGLQNWINLSEGNIKGDNLTKSDGEILSEIKEPKCQISQEEKECREKQENLQGLQDQLNRLLKDNAALEEQLRLMGNKDLDIEKYKNEVCSLSQQLESKVVELLSKEHECDRLKEHIEKLTLECEKVPALVLQVQLYEADFNHERAAREKLAEEKEEMAEQVRYLQSRLEALEKERPVEQKEESRSVFGLQKGSKSQCPKCRFAFSNLNTLAEHWEECLNTYFYP